MGKILSIRLDKGTFSDKYSSIITNPNSASFKKDIKGYCLQTISSKYLLVDRNPLPLNGIYTVVIWAKTIKGVFNMGLSSVGIYAPGLVLKHAVLDRAVIYNDINNFKVLDGVITDKWHCFIFTSIGNSQSDFISSKLYLDNKELPIFSITNTAPQIVRDFRYIGGSNTSDKGASISKIEIYDHVLTSKEREKEQIEFEAAQPLTYQKRLLQLPKLTELKQQGLIAAYNMKPVGGVLHDISGNGNHGTTNGCLKLINGVRFNGISDRVSKSAISDISTTKKFTICIRIKPNNIINGQQIVVNGNSGTDRCGIVIVSNTIGIETYNGTYKSANGAITNKTVNSFVAICNENTLSAYLNGVLVSGTSTTGNLVNTLSGFAIGSSVLNSNYFNGEIYDIRIYNRVLSTQEIKAYHNSFNEITLQESFDDMAVGSSKLPNGWIKNGGSFVCGENTTNDAVIKSIRKRGKYLKCNTAGIVAIPCKQAYGTWEFDWFKGGDGNTSTVYFVNQTVYSYPNSFNSYWINFQSNESIELYKTPATRVLSSTSSYVTNNTWYRIRITRTTLGVFSVYILGGNFTNWTLVSTTGGSGTNPVTDNTYTTSNYFVMDLDANDRVSNICINSQILV